MTAQGAGRDLAWISLLFLALVATGLGIRDPWPADEPRFVAVARDMVASGEWLFPRVGGDLYPDKPPLYFWLLAFGTTLAGSWRAGFLIPSLLAAWGTLALIHDLGRRLHGRAAALTAALVLACTLQFVLAARAAQIDATLCFFTTLALYGLLRHLLLGPAWGWYALGGLAAGLGVITKGVGFLPLLVLLPYGLMRTRNWTLPAVGRAMDARWLLAPAGLLLGIALWLLPMIIAVARDPSPELIAYRDEILFRQTVGRYAAAWHHGKPWYYFVVEVIPVLWLPWSLLVFWLWPQWRAAWRALDARVWLPLAWVVLVVLFFSLSSGKRGIYVLPALPALALAAAPALSEVLRRPGPARAGLFAAAALALATVAIALAWYAGVPAVRGVLDDTGLTSGTPLAALAAACIIAWLCAWRWRPLLAWPGVLAATAMAFSWLIAPQIDATRSGAAFMGEVQRLVPPDRPLGLLSYKEQFLLHLDRPIVNFGHARWREGQRETDDAASWLAATPNGVLLVPDDRRDPCFTSAVVAQPVGRSARREWWLISGIPAAACVARGDPKRALVYETTSR